MSGKIKRDLTGEIFGRWTVIKRDEDNLNKDVVWICKCLCGNIGTVAGDSLKSGNSKSCGCLNKELASQRRYVDLIGKKFGRLTVIKDVGRKHGEILWLCQCSCGNEKITVAGSLKNGDTQSCGCYQKEMASKSNYRSLVGKKFGKLTVIKDVGRKIMSNQIKVQYLCQCDCGNSVIVSSNNLVQNKTKSCGCLAESWIAFELKKYYKKNYDAEIEYKAFKNPKTNCWLKYDIYINKHGIFIEVNGLQHYVFTKHWHETRESFEYDRKLYKTKKNYAKKNGFFIEIDLRKIKTIEKAIEYINKQSKNILNK